MRPFAIIGIHICSFISFVNDKRNHPSYSLLLLFFIPPIVRCLTDYCSLSIVMKTATLALHVMRPLVFPLLETVQSCKHIISFTSLCSLIHSGSSDVAVSISPMRVYEILYSPCSLFQPSAETILQEVVQREALNGVHNIDTVKMVTPAVLVRLQSCLSLYICVSSILILVYCSIKR